MSVFTVQQNSICGQLSPEEKRMDEMQIKQQSLIGWNKQQESVLDLSVNST